MTGEVYVYRLKVDIPEEYRPAWPKTWTPPGWHDGHKFCADWRNPDARECVFRWPAKRHCMSRSTATRWAKRLREWGATVEVERSQPVVFEVAS